MQVYKAAIVDQIQAFYGDILKPKMDQTISNHLMQLANKMFKGIKQEKLCVFSQINNYHPDHLGEALEVLISKKLQLSDCQHSIANEYGFGDWNAVEALGMLKYNMDFENCIDSIITGNISSIRTILSDSPTLVNLKSQYGHQATLLHYTSSNGVELWRQQIPYNLPEIVTLLLASGSDKSAKMKVYGGAFTTMELLSTSAHPKKVNLLSKLIEIF